MSLYTHWVCFSCRKSFHNRPRKNGRTCPDCGNELRNMGIYFEPPRRRATRSWSVMELLADNGLRFGTEGTKSYVDTFLLRRGRPGIETVRSRIRAMREADDKALFHLRITKSKDKRKRRRS
jgi:hypothetical protein